MQKKSVLALLLALALLLSGCALVTVDQEKDNARVIVDVNGETVNKQTINTVVQNYLSQYEYYAQMFASSGQMFNVPTQEEMESDVIDSFVQNLVLVQKAKEMGMDKLTDEEQAEVEETAKTNYDSFIQSAISAYLSGSSLEGDELTQAAEKYVQDNHIAEGRNTLDYFLKTAAESKAVEKLEAEVVKDLAVSDEEITAAFTAKADEAKATYDLTPNQYGTDVNNGNAVYYAPAGYRMVQHILIAVSDEDQAVIDQAQTALTEAQNALNAAAEDADKAALQAAVDAAQAALTEAQATGTANAKAKADEVRALAVADGADFDALVAEYSTDPGTKPQGYAVREGYTDFETEFVDGAMALANVGDVSEPVQTSHGFHILKYLNDVQEGPVELTDALKDTLSADLLTEKQNNTTDETIKQWISEAKVKTYPERLK